MRDPKQVFEYEEVGDGYCKLTQPYLGVCALRAPTGEHRRHIVYINEGFVFRTSFPADWLKYVFDPSKMREATLVHDFCYRHKGKLLPAGGIMMKECGSVFIYKTDVTRALADQLFRELLELGALRTWIAYNATRWFGQKQWDDPFQPHPEDTSTRMAMPSSLITEL